MRKKLVFLTIAFLLAAVCSIGLTKADADGYFLKSFWNQEKKKGEKKVSGIEASMNEDYHAKASHGEIVHKPQPVMKVEGKLYEMINDLDYEKTPAEPQLKSDAIPENTVKSIVTYIGNGSVIPAGTIKNPKTPLERKQRIAQLIRGIATDALSGRYPKGQYPEKELKSQVQTKISHIDELLQLSTNSPLNELAEEAKHHFNKAIEENSVKEFYKATFNMRFLIKSM
ncbi:hypothetical protein MUN89_17240 [Halobacillus salinarum]|uniref:S-layer homology domain-containing protein n=1 Tax=Halobacillus salinarum TaxID=2932257 RepID=A0ABY4ENE3_9BACI|nr:hypothetical protein [Halobacillus salinarum]UOQ43631.1 hypothetical protein MUN89_17240 [Halobacillus salinarum]